MIVFGARTGLNALDVVDAFINNIGIVASAVMLVAFVIINKKLPELRAYLNSVSSVKVPKAWDIVVGIVAPIALAVMLLGAIVDYIGQGLDGYEPSYVAIFGWGSIAFVVVFAFIMTSFKWRVNQEEAPADDLAPAASSDPSVEGGAK